MEDQALALAEQMPLIMLPIALGVVLGLLLACRIRPSGGGSPGQLPPWASVLSLWLTCLTLKGAADRIRCIERSADRGE